MVGPTTSEKIIGPISSVEVEPHHLSTQFTIFSGRRQLVFEFGIRIFVGVYATIQISLTNEILFRGNRPKPAAFKTHWIK